MKAIVTALRLNERYRPVYLYFTGTMELGQSDAGGLTLRPTMSAVAWRAFVFPSEANAEDAAALFGRGGERFHVERIAPGSELGREVEGDPTARMLVEGAKRELQCRERVDDAVRRVVRALGAEDRFPLNKPVLVAGDEAAFQERREARR